jgi:hypothetical protein
MTQEKFNQIKEYEWDKFSRRYPALTNDNIIGRILLLFGKKDELTAKLLWENGFLAGVVWAYKQQEGDQ